MSVDVEDVPHKDVYTVEELSALVNRFDEELTLADEALHLAAKTAVEQANAFKVLETKVEILREVLTEELGRERWDELVLIALDRETERIDSQKAIDDVLAEIFGSFTEQDFQALLQEALAQTEDEALTDPVPALF